MSFDLAVWRSDGFLGNEEAGEIYRRLCGSDTISCDDDLQINAFYAEVTGRYPEIDTVPEDYVDGSPWACALDRSGRHVLMAIVPSRASELVAVVAALARKHQLLCFDPQNGIVLVQHP